MHILVAPNAFKNSITAQAAADVLMAIGNEPSDIPIALARTEQNSTRIAKDLADLINMRI